LECEGAGLRELEYLVEDGIQDHEVVCAYLLGIGESSSKCRYGVN
jgi:hypothetical protein